MNRPLTHKHRKEMLQKKMLQKMDYSNVIRKSYSRPRNSRTTDPLVIEEVIKVDKNSPRSKVTFR